MGKKDRQIRIVAADELSEADYEILADVSRRSYEEFRSDDINARDVDMTVEQLRRLVEGMTLFIMYIDGVVAGYARGLLRETEEGAQLDCEGNCSLPEYRRYSPGAMLTRAREKWAIEHGAVYSVLCTSCRAKKAIRYHHANGYKNWRYLHIDGKNYINIAMRKDYGKPYPTYKRLKHLLRTWLQVTWRYKSDGSPRF